MSSVYTGVPANVTPSIAPTETIPADGDALAAASVNPALQKLLDFVANIYGASGAIHLGFGCTTTINTTTAVFLNPGGATAPANALITNARYFAGHAFVVKRWQLGWTNAGAGTGNTTVTVMKNGVATALSVSVVTNGSAGPFFLTGTSVSFAQDDSIGIQVQAAAGVTTGISNVLATLFGTLA